MRLLIFLLTIFLFYSSKIFPQEEKSVFIEKEEGAKEYIILEPFEEKETKYVDEEGKIYIKRGYRGVVPGIRNESDIPFKKVKEERKTLRWVGFQPFKLYSRIFIQTTGKPVFIVEREEAKKISVLIEDSLILVENDKREIITKNFPTSVEKIEIKEVVYKKGKQDILVNIYLKKPAGYLYRQEDNYIFIDIETEK